MSIEYLVDGNKFSFSYQEMKRLYLEFSTITDKEFMNRLPDILHFAVYAAWIKEIPSDICLSDKGIIHQLTHLLTTNDPIIDLQEIRNLFNNQLIFL